MLAYRQSGRILKSVASASKFQSQATRFYSAHNEENHGKNDEHGHDDHSLPLSESESIFNIHTAKFASIIALIIGYSTINSSYEKSHDGHSLLSIIQKPQILQELELNYSQYRERVKKQEEVQEMIVFPSVERRSYSNLITSIDEVPGRFFASGSNTQFNTIQNFDALAPRKAKESPFY